MKIKLIRAVALLFALSSALSVMPINSAHADAATDQQALALIAKCHGKQGGSITGCDVYANCQPLIVITDICKAVRRLDSPNLALSDASLKKCTDQNHKQQACIDNFTQCLSSHLKGGKVSAANAKACAATTEKGTFADSDKPNPEKKETKCIITGIGWIVCPVMNFMALLVDTSYDLVSSLLSVQPLYIQGQSGASDGSAGTYQAWSIMRNIANVMFVVAFLVIIFSQVTSIGISNYGIKRLLPRLVVAAILVNLSYWLCAIAVDISNILGTSFGDLFKNLKASLTQPTLTGLNTSSTGWVGITGAVLGGTIAATAIIYTCLTALIPILLPALLAVVTVFLVLTLRQALIILLIVISPLAFVAYLLPNTEQYFKRWRELFQTLLLMYPIIAIIFGVSSLASQIVMDSAPDTKYKIPIQIMGAGIAIIPLFITPIVMKTAGGLLNRFGGFVNNPNRGPYDRLRKKGEALKDRRQDVAHTRRINRARGILGRDGSILGEEGSRRRRVAGRVAGFGTTGALINEQKAVNAKKALAESKQDYLVDRAGSGTAAADKFAQAVAGPTGDISKITAAAIAAQKNETAEAIKNAQLSADIAPGDMVSLGNMLKEAIQSGDSVGARAAQNMLMKSGGAGLDQYRKTMTEVEGQLDTGSGVGRDLRENILTNHGDVKAAANDIMEQAITGRTMSDVSDDAATWSKLSDSELVKQKPAALQKAIDSGAVTKEQAQRLLGNPQLERDLSSNIRPQIERLAK